MSQFQLQNAQGQSVVYGFDRVAGYFIQIYSPRGDVAVDRNSLNDGLTGCELVELAGSSGVSLPDDHELCAMLDLPIGDLNPLFTGK